MRLDAILQLLERLCADSNRDRAVVAQAILSIIDLKFVFCLHIFHDILAQMKAASDSLQSVQLHASAACDLKLSRIFGGEVYRSLKLFPMLFNFQQTL
jgi:hypothetical protein